MKKVFIEAYLEKNLGDDLFVDILVNRYKNINFYSCSSDYYKTKNSNLKIYSGFYVKILNKIMEKFFKEYKFFNKRIQKKCDYMVSIGGSIFMEFGSIDKMKKFFSFYNMGIPYCIIGANYGPSKTDEFKKIIGEILLKADDVCFRDNFSKDTFDDLSNVRFAPDIVFSYDISKFNICDEKRVVISVIDCETKFSKEKKEAYNKKIVELCEMFVEKGYEVYLMSFCQVENDEKAIKEIMNQCNKNIRKKVKKYFYRGNISEALEIIAKSSIVVGSRFHANIIGLLFNKTIIPIIYSNKTLNMLKDLNFNGTIIKIDEIEKFDINKISDKDLKYKIDITIQKNDSEKQFQNLDIILNKRNGGEYGEF